MSTNRPQVPAAGAPGLRVPFGLRDGRAYAPSEVQPGQACGCVCPGCGQPLVAKAQASLVRRPHFAHLSGTGCATGFETGVHLRAKQLIQERARILMPKWDGRPPAMTNPPCVSDLDGYVLTGPRVDVPAVVADLVEVGLEQALEGYVPDVIAHDAEGQVLIEVRVTHAVDGGKEARVRADGRRMMEIDLSGVDREIVGDPEAFERAVLMDPGNRHWVVHPSAEARWEALKMELEPARAERNSQIQARREQARRDRERRQAEQRSLAREKAAAKERVRARERAALADELAALEQLADHRRMDEQRRERTARARARVGQLQAGLDPAVRSACMQSHPDAWVYGVDPALWQLEAYFHFVAGKEAGTAGNARDIGYWLRGRFPYEKSLYRLFRARYTARSRSRDRGYWKNTLDYWVFTEEENRLIPDFYAPINTLLEQWAAAQLVQRVYYPRGTFVIRPTPERGLRPALLGRVASSPSGGPGAI
jgi:hypothetical protein